MQIILLCFLVLIHPISSEIQLEKDNNESVEQIEEILLNNKLRKVVLIKSNDTNNSIFQELSAMVNGHYIPIITIKIENIKFFNRKYQNFSYNAIYEDSKINIVLAGNMNNFPKILNETMKLYYWRSRERTIVHFENGSLQEMTDLFKTCWKKNITNIIFMFSNGVYTYNPFYNDFAIRLNGTNVFFDKYVDMNGHLIKFSRFYTALDMITFKNRDVGRDAFLAHMLAWALNANYKYLAPRDNITYGLKFPNGSMTGMGKIILKASLHFE